MLKLRYSTTSPYVRKVTATIHECGLEHQVERQLTNPWAPDTDLPITNPLGKVPALTTESGKVLFDSPVICEFLDSLCSTPRLFPQDGEARWNALQQQALGDGILDAAIGRLLEGRRPPELQSQTVADRFAKAIERSLDTLEGKVDELSDGFTIGQITVGVALGYLDFRFSADDWRAGRPGLTKWHESVSSRPSLMQTVPHE
ncbi:MAG: glutathione S-transferase N-terminal domain-containing protein [Acidiferrobacterales bacterium]|nr:glutathione S-transferase N-terminal domain-containing protein [Acidiferrobacterales bacterium]